MTEIDLSSYETTTEQDGRHITVTYFLSGHLPTDRSEDTGSTQRITVKVKTSHFGPAEYVGRPHKCFQTDVTRVRLQYRFGPERGPTGYAFETYSGVGLTSVPCERYSAKLLKAAHEIGMAALTEHLDNPKIVQMFTEDIPES